MKKIIIGALLAAMLVMAPAASAKTITKLIMQPSGTTVVVELDYHSYNAQYWQMEQYRIHMVFGSTTTFNMWRFDMEHGGKAICSNHSVGTGLHTHTGNALVPKDYSSHQAWWGSWPSQMFWVPLP